MAELPIAARDRCLGRSGRPNSHRAGLEILKDCLDGVLPISWPPPREEDAAESEASSSSCESEDTNTNNLIENPEHECDE